MPAPEDEDQDEEVPNPASGPHARAARRCNSTQLNPRLPKSLDCITATMYFLFFFVFFLNWMYFLFGQYSHLNRISP